MRRGRTGTGAPHAATLRALDDRIFPAVLADNHHTLEHPYPCVAFRYPHAGSAGTTLTRKDVPRTSTSASAVRIEESIVRRQLGHVGLHIDPAQGEDLRPPKIDYRQFAGRLDREAGSLSKGRT